MQKKVCVKNATGVDISDFAKTTDLANSKSDVGKLDINKLKDPPSDLDKLKSKVGKLDNIGELETTQVALSKLSSVEKNNAVKKTKR